MKNCKDSSCLGLIPYTGNKQELLPQLMDLFPPRDSYTRFVDCFCGGLSVSLNVEKPVLSNDIDNSLIQMYESLAALPSLSEVEEIIKEYRLGKNHKEEYLSFREMYNKNKNPLWLYILILHAFSNINRTNAVGDFNASYGFRTITHATRKRFQHFKDNLEGITFSSRKFQELELRDGDFVYCDPPYLITDAPYNKYWGEAQELLLYSFLDDLDRRGIKFGMSNVLEHNGRKNSHLEAWMSKYNVELLDKRYLLGQHGSKYEGLKTKEVYICNYEGTVCERE